MLSYKPQLSPCEHIQKENDCELSVEQDVEGSGCGLF